MDAWVISYDIPSDERRRAIAAVLESYGERIQYSVFWCGLGATRCALLRNELAAHVLPAEDQVLFIRLGPIRGRGGDAISALGRPFVPPDLGPVIL